MTMLNSWHGRRQLGDLGQALFTQAARNMGYLVSDIGFEYQVGEPTLQNLHLIGADLAGPDHMASKPGATFAADVKTSGLYQPLAEQMTWICELRHLVALETYATQHGIPTCFSFVDPFRQLVYLCPPAYFRYAMEPHYGKWRIRARQLPRYWYWFGEDDQAA